MNQSVLDTQQLISFWRKRQRESALRTPDEATAAAWAKLLERQTGTAAIVSLTHLEFLGGAGSGDEVRAYRAFLAELEVVDNWEVRPSDFDEARRRAGRVPRDGRPRGAVGLPDPGGGRPARLCRPHRRSRLPARLIREAGREPVERDTLYRRVLRDAGPARAVAGGRIGRGADGGVNDPLAVFGAPGRGVAS